MLIEEVRAAIDALYTPEGVQPIANQPLLVMYLATSRVGRVFALQRLVVEMSLSKSRRWRGIRNGQAEYEMYNDP